MIALAEGVEVLKIKGGGGQYLYKKDPLILRICFASTLDKNLWGKGTTITHHSLHWFQRPWFFNFPYYIGANPILDAMYES